MKSIAKLGSATTSGMRMVKEKKPEILRIVSKGQETGAIAPAPKNVRKKICGA
jgi:hypothetical protein